MIVEKLKQKMGQKELNLHFQKRKQGDLHQGQYLYLKHIVR